MPVSKKELKSQPGKISLTFKVKKEAAGDAKEVYLLFEGFGWEPEEMRLLKSGDFKSRLFSYRRTDRSSISTGSSSLRKTAPGL